MLVLYVVSHQCLSAMEDFAEFLGDVAGFHMNAVSMLSKMDSILVRTATHADKKEKCCTFVPTCFPLLVAGVEQTLDIDSETQVENWDLRSPRCDIRSVRRLQKFAEVPLEENRTAGRV